MKRDRGMEYDEETNRSAEKTIGLKKVMGQMKSQSNLLIKEKYKINENRYKKLMGCAKQ